MVSADMFVSLTAAVCAGQMLHSHSHRTHYPDQLAFPITGQGVLL